MNNNSVSLTELFIIVVILAVLSVIAMPRIAQSASNEMANSCKPIIDILNSAIELYNSNNGKYPADLTIITSDKKMFPEGPPTCQITETEFSPILVNSKVDKTDHNH